MDMYVIGLDRTTTSPAYLDVGTAAEVIANEGGTACEERRIPIPKQFRRELVERAFSQDTLGVRRILHEVTGTDPDWFCCQQGRVSLDQLEVAVRKFLSLA